jgi:hypothetical protein
MSRFDFRSWTRTLKIVWFVFVVQFLLVHLAFVNEYFMLKLVANTGDGISSVVRDRLKVVYVLLN